LNRHLFYKSVGRSCPRVKRTKNRVDDSQIRLAPAKILLVDDRPENLLALEGLLRLHGREILTASSGIAALEMLIHHRVALALLDVQMPDMNGIELAELMRASEDTRAIPIIFVTAGVQDCAIQFRGFDAGAVDFLFKPLNERVVRSKVKVFLELDQQKRLLEHQVASLETARAELERSRNLLATSNRELERFAYVASHDMKEPLRMIGSYLSLLQRRFAASLEPDAKQYIEAAAGGAKRLQGLIDSLIRLSKVGHGATEITQCDVREIVNEVLLDLVAVIGERSASVIVGDLPTVPCDRAQFRQLFQNFIGNALKFTRNNRPEIVVGVEASDNGWIFCVQDNGIGIPDADRERLFEPFARGHSRSEFAGDGIGLSICKTIVEKHGGRLWLESKEGEGSSFFFSLPATQGTNVPESFNG